jgi:hypothetical protein
MLSTPKAYAATAAVAAVEKKSPPVTKAPKRDQKDVLYTVADIVAGGRRESVSDGGEKAATLVPRSGGSAGVGTACGKNATGMITATGTTIMKSKFRKIFRDLTS